VFVKDNSPLRKRIRPYLKVGSTSYLVDETYIKVAKACKYLYRATDKQGRTIEFMLSAKRDVLAAKRFFKKMMRAEHHRLPFSISVDKNAAYPDAFSSLQANMEPITLPSAMPLSPLYAVSTLTNSSGLPCRRR
jgi:transposase-like protein